MQVRPYNLVTAIKGELLVAKKYTTEEALEILQKHYVTKSIQMVRRFIKEGKLEAERITDEKTGKRRFIIDEDSLMDFIEIKKPGMIEKVNMINEIKKDGGTETNTSGNTVSFNEAHFQQTNELLTELVEISKILVKKMDMLIDQNSKETRTKKTVVKDQHATKTLEKFVKHIEKKVKTADLANEELMKQAYSVYYDKSGVMKTNIKSNGEYKCPETGIKDSRFVNLIKKAVPMYIKKKTQDAQLSLFDLDDSFTLGEEEVELK